MSGVHIAGILCMRVSYDSVREAVLLCTVGCRAILGEGEGGVDERTGGLYLWRRMTNAGGMDDAGRGLGTCFSTDATHRWVRGCHAYCIKRAWVGVTDTCKCKTTGVGSWSLISHQASPEAACRRRIHPSRSYRTSPKSFPDVN